MKIIDQKGNPEKINTPDQSVETTTKVGNANSYRRNCPLSKQMITILLQQMSEEKSNHDLYETFANYFKKQGLTKIREYFHQRAMEEHNHYQWIKKYLEYQDAEFIIPAVERVDIDINDRIVPFEATVDREIQTTMNIYKIMDLAKEENDYATISWLYGSSPCVGKLIPEQIEEEMLSRQVLKICRNAGQDWLDIQDAVEEFYNRK